MHAADVVLALTPYLPYLAEGAAKKLGEQASEGVLALLKVLRARFKRPSSNEALTDLQAHGDDPDMQAAFRVALKKELSEQPDLVPAIAPLIEGLRAAAPQVIAQTANVTGDGNTVNQVAGSNVRVGR